jgi:hypothetical protein
MWHVWGTGEVITGRSRGNLRAGDHLEDAGIDGRTSKWIFNKWRGGMGMIDLAEDRADGRLP